MNQRLFLWAVLLAAPGLQAAPTFLVPLASNIAVPAATGSTGVGLGVLDFQPGAVGFAVTISNLSDILAADIRMVRAYSRTSYM